MSTEESLKKIHARAQSLGKTAELRVSFAGGAVKTIGNILFSHESGAVEGLLTTDIQGLAMAVECLGDHLEHLADEMTGHGDMIRGHAEQLLKEATQ